MALQDEQRLPDTWDPPGPAYTCGRRPCACVHLVGGGTSVDRLSLISREEDGIIVPRLTRKGIAMAHIKD
ncbi:hypothetical protein EYF80_015009 [Liparis tanakae]|uniref:Uncharacterized protein n=1 Tax=Liparis tanakae TaxID=230148 RepID=A0A4Z2IAA3_9TELE|nr:hypothetical protein EYF80_015009 [Liparis tanakae]